MAKLQQIGTPLNLANWRDELTSYPLYKKRFAIMPTECSDGTKVWFKFYYSKYNIWTVSHGHKIYEDDNYYHHADFVERITEAEYICRRLIEGT
jgi:hypothetical protein